MSSEKAPLLSKKAKGKDEGGPPIVASSTPTAYFLDGAHRRAPSTFSFYYSKDSIRDNEEIDKLPTGALSEAEFNARPVTGKTNASEAVVDLKKLRHRQGMRAPSMGGDWLSYIVGSPRADSFDLNGIGTAAETGEIGTLLIPRKVPIKVEPKVHFGNERTFLAWLHVVTMLAAASVTIVTFSEGKGLLDQLFGIILLPVSVAYIFYALTQYVRRAIMIKHHQPGPYIDIFGPTFLTLVVSFTIIIQFFGKLHSFM